MSDEMLVGDTSPAFGSLNWAKEREARAAVGQRVWMSASGGVFKHCDCLASGCLALGSDGYYGCSVDAARLRWPPVRDYSAAASPPAVAPKLDPWEEVMRARGVWDANVTPALMVDRLVADAERRSADAWVGALIASRDTAPVPQVRRGQWVGYIPYEPRAGVAAFTEQVAASFAAVLDAKAKDEARARLGACMAEVASLTRMLEESRLAMKRVTQRIAPYLPHE